MARVFRFSPILRAGNSIGTGMLIRFGIGSRNAHAVTVTGRRSGKSYATPMRVVEHGDGRYLVAAFGETETIKNLRAAGQTTLVRGGRREDVGLVELPEASRVPVLRDYLRLSGRMSRFFGATADSPDEALARAAPEHTVFRIEPR
jgi:deazaflavin-dependent oxidoreductase (nitroreductase family)